MSSTQQDKTAQDRAYIEFELKHLSQLQAIPKPLWKTLHTNLRARKFGAQDTLEVKPGDDGSPQCTARTRLRRTTLLVFPHAWTFFSLEEARQHLDSSLRLRASIATLLQNLDASEGRPATLKNYLTTDQIATNLYRIAFQYQLASYDPTTNTVTPKTYKYVCTDKLSPALIPFGYHRPNLTCNVFVDLGDSSTTTTAPQAYTICYPSHEKGFLAGSPVTRSELTPMPDYSNPEYWKRHYATSSLDRRFEWFAGWEHVEKIVEMALPETCKAGGVVLNIGCGNSEVGRKMIDSRLAKVVLSVDIAEAAVKALSVGLVPNVHGTSAPPGMEDFLVLDASHLPLRSNASVDWAFDKGTLDGLMYQTDAVHVLKRIWNEVRRVLAPHGVFMLVSVGSPEGRLSLIEDVVGGWTVEKCFEIGGLSGQSMGQDSYSSVDKCYVYVCVPS
ncbi:hypothetical protein HDV00_003155 [Rhizophlyctis rosea]|nr:hypothetical protein HDV00_003155 [Rhizophlyctis rosea]